MRTLLLLLTLLSGSIYAQDVDFAPNRLIIQFEAQYNPVQIESLLSTGIYTLEVETENGVRTFKKLIVN